MKSAGFTLVELVVVIVLLGILAFSVLPKFDLGAFGELAFRDQVASALRFSQSSASSHRRLTCAIFTASSATFSVASTNPASGCDSPLVLPSGGNVVSAQSGGIGFSAVPAPLFFQPDGRITSDSGGSVLASTPLVIGGQAIIISGGGGYVR